MEFSLILGVAIPVVVLGAWLVMSVILPRLEARAVEHVDDTPPHLSDADRKAAERARHLHDHAVAGQMAATTSARLQV